MNPECDSEVEFPLTCKSIADVVNVWKWICPTSWFVDVRMMFTIGFEDKKAGAWAASLLRTKSGRLV